MALQKQPVAINFIQGLDTKTDPYQVRVGNFLTLVNSVFTTSGRLTKRTGFENITITPHPTLGVIQYANYSAMVTAIAQPMDGQTGQTVDTGYLYTGVNGAWTITPVLSTLTTLNDNLIATGSNIYAYSQDTNQWLNQGNIQPIQLSTLPLIRASTSQSSPDSQTASNGLVCLVYMDSGQAYYQISDSVTGQQIVGRTSLPSTAVFPRIFILGNYFIVTFLDTIVTTHLQYIAIPLTNPNNPRIAADFSTTVSSLSAGYDGLVVENNLYIAWASSSSTVGVAYLTTSLAVSPTTTLSGVVSATLMTLASDSSTSTLYVTFSDGTAGIDIAALNYSLVVLTNRTHAISQDICHLTSVATSGLLSIFFEYVNTYGYDSNIRTDTISSVQMTTAGVVSVPSNNVGSPASFIRSVGLASKAFIGSNGTIYMYATYGDTNLTPSTDDSNQPTYFLIDNIGNIYMKLAYSNGGGYYPTQVLPSVSSVNGQYQIAYSVNDFLAAVNKGTNLPVGTPVNAIYTQTGVNLSKFTINNQQYSVEIAGTLNLTGGILWEYDGVKPVENNFNVWPENVEATTSTSGGLITAGTYYYVFTYEWTNNQGNLERSAPSIPIAITTTGSTSTNTIHVPTDRLTYKVTPNPIRIVGYRWSVAQQVYYQFTSLTSPTLNITTIDYVTFTDTLADSAILGNVILYTTGGVVEDIGAPPSIASALFDNRVWLIDAEDQNLLWYSKQVIENVPVEMSDLLTFYVAPTTSAQGSTGKMTAIYPMDDKLIIFKKDAIYYINGTGPDNTGSNSQYSQPIFITSAVGTSNPNSIVLTLNGLQFQSDKGIWLLGRDLSTNYVGAPVESFNSNTVLSATAIPATTQVRFVLDDNITLMYDYFFKQWATHTNVSAISATLYEGSHTYLNSYGQVFQEAVGTYVDGSEPVLMSLTTSWINIAGLQGFERFYFGYLLGTYFSPFILNMTLAYNYNPSPTQSIQITPDNYTQPWGNEAVWGAGGQWGSDQPSGSSSQANVFAARFFPQIQKCESFQVSLQEVYDPSLGAPAGEGLSLSGLSLITGGKKGYRTQSARKSFG